MLTETASSSDESFRPHTDDAPPSYHHPAAPNPDSDDEQHRNHHGHDHNHQQQARPFAYLGAHLYLEFGTNICICGGCILAFFWGCLLAVVGLVVVSCQPQPKNKS